MSCNRVRNSQFCLFCTLTSCSPLAVHRQFENTRAGCPVLVIELSRSAVHCALSVYGAWCIYSCTAVAVSDVAE